MFGCGLSCLNNTATSSFAPVLHLIRANFPSQMQALPGGLSRP